MENASSDQAHRDSVSDLAYDVVSGAAQLLHTALSTLMSAIACTTLVNAANMIDGTWTLAVERQDDGGSLGVCTFFRAGRWHGVSDLGFCLACSYIRKLGRITRNIDSIHNTSTCR
jgi:hypothetical protein